MPYCFCLPAGGSNALTPLLGAQKTMKKKYNVEEELSGQIKHKVFKDVLDLFFLIFMGFSKLSG